MAGVSSPQSAGGVHEARALGPWAFCLLSSAFCLLPTGCGPENFGASGNDPLLGAGPAVRPPSAAAGADRSTAGVVPALPPSPSAGTPAALTGAPRGPLDPSRPELRIGAGGGAAAPGGPTWQGAGAATSGVVLQPPQPLTTAPSSPGVVPAGNAGTATYEQLKAQLLARGATSISITCNVETGETKLICHVPRAGSPNVRQAYEVKARDEVSAMRAVLDRINAGQ